MNELLPRFADSWRDGGPVMPALALCGFAIWLLFLRLRAQFLEELSEPAGGVLDRLRHAGPALDEFRRVESERLRRNLVLLHAVTAAAPLLGLLGTVTGMMTTFAAEAGDTRVLSGGIREALITTQVGLLLALPGVFGAARLQRLLRELTLRMAGVRGEA
jgi:biopolymer transport protein ExbB/TolQ